MKREKFMFKMNKKGLTPYLYAHPNRFGSPDPTQGSNRTAPISNPAGPTRCFLSLRPKLLHSLFCTPPAYCLHPHFLHSFIFSFYLILPILSCIFIFNHVLFYSILYVFSSLICIFILILGILTY